MENSSKLENLKLSMLSKYKHEVCCVNCVPRCSPYNQKTTVLKNHTGIYACLKALGLMLYGTSIQGPVEVRPALLWLVV